jgi:SPP1 family phage portal protein
VNFTDEAFSGNQSGVAISYKLISLESKCITMERKFSSALRRMFKVIQGAWVKRGYNFNYLDVFFSFKRNLPENVMEEADISLKLKGLVSEDTRLSLLSFVDDVEYEKERMKEDNENLVDLDSLEVEDNVAEED